MGKERFIKGKVDNCKHDGKRAHMRRLDAVIQKERDYKEGLTFEAKYGIIWQEK